MNSNNLGSFGKSFVTCIVALLVLSASVMVIGCGQSGGPEGAVQKYLKAMQNLNWEDYKASVTPGQQELTKEEEELAKQEFEQVEVNCEGLKYKTDYVKGDKNKAVVVLTDGKITYTAEILGEKKTETLEIKKMVDEDRPAFNVVKVKDVWYVDIPLG
ncbi:MAG: hypothetical protein JW738_00395 [Actinobacteria bacterium]|nr:hypothetical protein [Actinomycetota bacterium]